MHGLDLMAKLAENGTRQAARALRAAFVRIGEDVPIVVAADDPVEGYGQISSAGYKTIIEETRAICAPMGPKWSFDGSITDVGCGSGKMGLVAATVCPPFTKIGLIEIVEERHVLTEKASKRKKKKKKKRCAWRLSLFRFEPEVV